MARITHVFFEVPGVLVDRAALRRDYTLNLGRIMAARYGLAPLDWEKAYERVLVDWDSYYADLNLSGDDGIADLWEGQFRTTRALFRLTGSPEPAHDDLITFSRELPVLASQNINALYPDVPQILAQLDAAGFILGVVSYSISEQSRALLQPVIQHFKGAIWGADNAERFEKDRQRYQRTALSAQVDPANCLVVDDQEMALISARKAGMQTIHVGEDRRDLLELVERLSLIHKRKGQG